jgi:hypothetical protein
VSNSFDNSIAVYWNKITTDLLPILGYKLYADSGLDDEYMLVFDGTNMPEVNTFTFSNLNVLLTYRIYVIALNFNGAGLPSVVSSFKPCTNPSQL